MNRLAPANLALLTACLLIACGPIGSTMSAFAQAKPARQTPARASSTSTQLAGFKKALPGYKYSFPRDHGSHPEFKTEWWYYTGHLRDRASDRKFGYELTFFRSGVAPGNGVTSGPWAVTDLYLTHFAISDIASKKFFSTEKLSRSAPHLASASTTDLNVRNQDWHARTDGSKQKLFARDKGFELALDVTPLKPPVVHGKNGVSQKASCAGCASHYYSLTRMETAGTLKIGSDTFDVSGSSWMDHEFGSNQLTSEQVGWDWFSLQLDDGAELMLYQMRLKGGKVDPNSSGTYVPASGAPQHLTADQFSIQPKSTWKSPNTGGTYPMGWRLGVPSLGLQLEVDPEFEGQELSNTSITGVRYWEGASRVTGQARGRPVSGQAYVEMTGYAEEFRKRI